jgi:hypothetical protein
MAEIKDNLRARLEQDPQARIRLIVRVEGDLDQAGDLLRAQGWQVGRKMTLISGWAVEGSASQVLALAHESWVQSIEEDRVVHTM